MLTVSLVLTFIMFLLTIINAQSIRIPRNGRDVSASVAVLLPVRNEAANIVELVQSVLEDEVINSATDMGNTLSWDSISHMSIIIAIYSKFGIQFNPNQVAKAKSILEISKIINSKN